MYAGASHYFGWREQAYTSVPVIEGGTMAAGVSVPGIRFLWRFSGAASVCFIIYQWLKIPRAY